MSVGTYVNIFFLSIMTAYEEAHYNWGIILSIMLALVNQRHWRPQRSFFEVVLSAVCYTARISGRPDTFHHLLVLSPLGTV